MSTSSKKYKVRYYTTDDSFTRVIIPPSPVKELQVALAFARDYDIDDQSTNGVFKPYWNRANVTPRVISEFRRLNLPVKVKFFLTIGGRDPRYPFSVAPAQQAEWVDNATESLTAIIQEYHLDGIDIYYEHITGDMFVDTMVRLMANLRNNRVITVASIAPSASLNENYYLPLDQQYGNNIDTVVYQCHTEGNPITTKAGLRDRLQEIAALYTNKKFLAGYSNLSRDWYTVSAPLYSATIGQVVRKGTVSGPSIWTDSDEPGISFDPKWVPELVSLAINDNEP